VTGKVIAALEMMAEERPEDYRTFWSAFGAVFKEGVPSDHEHRERLAKLLRWPSTKEEFTSLPEYQSRMAEAQEAIYFATGLNRGAVEHGPHLEGLVKKGFEVIVMTDPIDEWVVQEIREFEGKKLISVLNAGLDLPAESSEVKAAAGDSTERLNKLANRAKTVLEETVSEVRVSNRLVDSPCCLAVPPGGIAPHIERLLRAQGQDVPSQMRILELNPNHPFVRRLATRCERDPESEEVADWLRLLHDQALLAEGSPIKDPQHLARRMAVLMAQALEEGGSAAAKEGG
jgi:molecular chaperone HtpG